MSKYGNSFAMAANSFEILQFVITFVHNTKQSTNLEYVRSKILVDNKDLHVTQISNLDQQFLVPTNLLFSSKFVYELAVSAS